MVSLGSSSLPGVLLASLQWSSRTLTLDVFDMVGGGDVRVVVLLLLVLDVFAVGVAVWAFPPCGYLGHGGGIVVAGLGGGLPRPRGPRPLLRSSPHTWGPPVRCRRGGVESRPSWP